MILYTKRLPASELRIAELHFRDTAVPAAVDIVRYRSRAERRPGAKLSYTLFVSLEDEPERLLSAMRKITRNQIRRAEKDGMRPHFNARPSPAELEEFFGFYDEFARTKRLAASNRVRLRAMWDSQALALSRVLNRDGETLTWHCYVHHQDWARLLHSASLFRSNGVDAGQISQANRYLHWHDMLRLRESGFRICDLGGWYGGTEDQEKLKINFFKEQFGGKIVELFNADSALTWKGALAIRVRSAMDRLRGVEN